MPIVKTYVVPHPPLIVPEVGGGSEKQVERTQLAYQEVAREIGKIKPDTIIITSPHSPLYTDYFHISPGKEAWGSFRQFDRSDVIFHEKYDEEFTSSLVRLCEEEEFPAGYLGEEEELDHGVMVPLYFIEKEYKDFQLVRIGLSNLSYPDHYRLGQLIQKVAEETDKKIVFIASGDLSHKLQPHGPYGFAPEGPLYDQQIIHTFTTGNFLELLEADPHFLEKAAICGHPSFTIMAGALDGVSVIPRFYVHEDVTGVGYGIASYTPNGKDENRKFLDLYYKDEKERIHTIRDKADPLVKLAVQTIIQYIQNHVILESPKEIEEEYQTRSAGVFVSIHKFGELRGCIGTFLPTTTSIADEVIQNAIEAATKDYRFSPITKDELDFLDVRVDVLSTPEKISGPEELDPKKYGVIVSSGWKRGLLLPDLEGIDTVEEQIQIAKRKADIKDDEEVSLERFEVVRHI